MTESEIAAAMTTPVEDSAGKVCQVGRFITEAEGWAIVAIAATWEGTPYVMVGAGSVKGVKGDCSGTTNKIYVEAGFPYPYKQTANFAAYVETSGRFRQVPAERASMQVGDVLLWPGHMAIYAPFPEGHAKRSTGVFHQGKAVPNDFYTAFNERTGQPYGPYNISTFRGDRFRVFRYLVLPGDPKC
jgi:hypothetical protein